MQGAQASSIFVGLIALGFFVPWSGLSWGRCCAAG